MYQETPATKYLARSFNIIDIFAWCAAKKVSVDEYSCLNFEILFKSGYFADILIRRLVSSLVVSVNEEELETIKTLKRLKFKKMPAITHWRYGGRTTYLYYYQFTKEEWNEVHKKRSEHHIGDFPYVNPRKIRQAQAF
jgi:hypothetical protein